jgi:type IV pilus assembly protein PilO
MNIDFKSPAVQKIALSVLLCAGILGGFFFSRVAPFTYPSQRDQMNALKTDYEKKSTELSRAKATVADLPRFEAEYAHLHERWQMAAQLLPTDRQMPVLLRKITLAAQQTGVEFVVFKPTDLRPSEHYTELPLQISVYGEYHRIGSFIAELANMRRIVTVANLNLKTSTKPNSTTSAEFTASAYSLNPSSAPAPAPPPAPVPADVPQGEPNGRKSS